VLVASTDGNTAAKAVDVFEGMQVVVVTHPYGIVGPNQIEFTEENRQKVLSKGGKIHTGSHAFIGLDEPMHYSFNQNGLGDIICNTLFLFGAGIKVICEISCMAADAGLIRTDEDIIAIAGTHRGADTAVVMTPVNIYQLFDLDIKEILCKPYRRIKPPHKGPLPYEVYGPGPETE
jgi:hypothetical protein